MRKRRRAGVAVAALATLGAAAALAAWFENQSPKEERRADAARLMNELMSGTAVVGGPFSLPDTQGKPRSLVEFRGTPVLLYFGFMYCPDVCPTDLLIIGKVVEALDARGIRVQPVFITLDPERDRPAALAQYVASFHSRLVALRGSEAETRAIATSYKVFYEKVRAPAATTYLIDHMALIFVLDREGRYLAALPSGTSAERMVEAVLQLVPSAK